MLPRARMGTIQILMFECDPPTYAHMHIFDVNSTNISQLNVKGSYIARASLASIVAARTCPAVSDPVLF